MVEPLEDAGRHPLGMWEYRPAPQEGTATPCRAAVHATWPQRPL